MNRISRNALIAVAGLVAAGFALRQGWRTPVVERSPGKAYVDSKQCKGCHAAIYAEYQRVGMARSFAPVTQAAAAEFAHGPSSRRYQVLQRGGKFLQRRFELDASGREINPFEQEMTHAIGSGNHARTYLHRSESGELTELPLTWYAQENRWGMSPGFDNPKPADFTRLADESCLFCHNGYPLGGSLADGIDCQRCHGPASRHVQLASSGKAQSVEIRAAIVNPARLNPDLQMDVCMQCHLETTSAQLPATIRRFDREAYSFRPGEPLGAYAVHFDHAPGKGHQDKFEIVNQAYRLRQSTCYQKSQGRLTCITCHNPHSAPRGEAAVSFYRAKCRACHQTVAVANHPDLQTSDCASCHMPRRQAEDVVHVMMTDHRIQRKTPAADRKGPPREMAASYRGPLIVYYPEGLPERERDLYLGAALIAGSADRRRGIELLDRLADANAPAKALAVLGEGYLEEGNTDRAIQMLRRAAEKDPALARVRYNLGQALEAANRLAEARIAYEQAIQLRTPFPEAQYALANILVKMGEPALATANYQNAIRARPVYAEAHSNLGNVYTDQGRLDEARMELEEALRIDPGFAEAHNNLARALAAQNRTPEALDHARRAVALNPDYVEAHYNLGRLLQTAGSNSAAIAEYRRALQLRPDFVDAHLSLGQTFGDAGQLDPAIAEFQQVLRLKPDHAEAQKNLAMALEMKRR